MGKLRVSNFAISLDGFGAGVEQSLEQPLGFRGPELHQWFFPTETFQSMHGNGSGTRGIDNDFASRGMKDIGAWIMGRNMFGPVRGPWPNRDWKGWWGDNPPYHVPVFVLSHHEREPLVMEGGTTFYFVTDGIESALEKARKAAHGKDVKIGGGVSTVRQYLKTRQIDELHLAVSPVFLGQGENLWAGLDMHELGYYIAESTKGENALHVTIRKR